MGWKCFGFERKCQRKAVFVGMGCALCARCKSDMDACADRLTKRYANNPQMAGVVTTLAETKPITG